MNADNVNDRLSASSNGTPQIDPDQRRRFLGTFRERVSFVIPAKDIDNSDAFWAFKQELLHHKGLILYINGNFDTSKLDKYVTFANQNNIQFTLKSDNDYDNPQLSYAIVYTTKSTPISVPHVLWNKKYTSIAEARKGHANDMSGHMPNKNEKSQKPKQIGLGAKIMALLKRWF